MEQVDDDPYFKRDGEDVHVEVPVTVSTFLLTHRYWLVDVVVYVHACPCLQRFASMPPLIIHHTSQPNPPFL